MPLELAASGESPRTVSCDALVVGAFADEPESEPSASAREVMDAIGEHVSSYLSGVGFKGKPGNVAVLPTGGEINAPLVAIVGLGERAAVGPAQVRRAAAAAARRVSQASVVATTLHRDAETDGAAAVAEGMLLGTYSFSSYKSDPKPSNIQRVLLLDAEAGEIDRGRAVGEAVILARDLTNEPASTLTPDALARRARDIADVAGLEWTVIEAGELGDRGFGGLSAVGRGSSNAPRFIELRYDGGGSTRLALVGKGVCFDSGGLSLKDAKNMETMKTDMAGAAAVIATMGALPRLGIAGQVIGCIPAVENMPGGSAMKPGDVIRHYGGKTSEVLNTDAEGRLILADALAYAAAQEPEAIVDVATLTGSIMIALGRKISGLFANDDRLAREIQEAAEVTGERLWRMPLFDEYSRELESEVADMKNVGSRYGGSIIAALFLHEHVADSIPWAHLDIAGTARAESDQDEGPKGGTGVATRTLIEWVRRRDAT